VEQSKPLDIIIIIIIMKPNSIFLLPFLIILLILLFSSPTSGADSEGSLLSYINQLNNDGEGVNGDLHAAQGGNESCGSCMAEVDAVVQLAANQTELQQLLKMVDNICNSSIGQHHHCSSQLKLSLLICLSSSSCQVQRLV